jgi:hypothetical protein
MIVLFTGMFRSGSTWAYNVARVLLLARSPAVFGEYRDDIAAALAVRAGQVEHHLIKTHRPDLAGRALIGDGRCRTICTYRAPLECIASNIETFGASLEETLALATEALAFLDFQSTIGGVMFIPYEDITERPQETVHAIGRHLGEIVPDAAAQRIAEHFSRDNVARFTGRFKDHVIGAIGAPEAWDSETLFYTDHIRARPSPPEALLSPAEIRQVLERLGDAVDERGRLADRLVRRLRDVSAAASAECSGRRPDGR